MNLSDKDRAKQHEIATPRPRRSSQKKSPRAQKRRAPQAAAPAAKEARRPAIGSLSRTRNLLLAALRVWELKQGLRN